MDILGFIVHNNKNEEVITCIAIDLQRTRSWKSKFFLQGQSKNRKNILIL